MKSERFIIKACPYCSLDHIGLELTANGTKVSWWCERMPRDPAKRTQKAVVRIVEYRKKKNAKKNRITC